MRFGGFLIGIFLVWVGLGLLCFVFLFGFYLNPSGVMVNVTENKGLVGSIFIRPRNIPGRRHTCFL